MESRVYDSSLPIIDFLRAAAGKQPTPGGGSVTALVGALAASMGEMVLHYSVGKKDLLEHQPKLEELLKEFERARSLLLQFMVEDQHAYATLTSARKTSQGKGDSDPTFAAALLACIRIPQAIGATAIAILDFAEHATPICNKWLLSDLAVCAELATATARCAAYNVRINLNDLSDAAEKEKLMKETDLLIRHAVERVQRVLPAIWKRVG
jgi:formiminotetrahydrofolate cyclodeaminase